VHTLEQERQALPEWLEDQADPVPRVVPEPPVALADPEISGQAAPTKSFIISVRPWRLETPTPLVNTSVPKQKEHWHNFAKVDLMTTRRKN